MIPILSHLFVVTITCESKIFAIRFLCDSPARYIKAKFALQFLDKTCSFYKTNMKVIDLAQMIIITFTAHLKGTLMQI